MNLLRSRKINVLKTRGIRKQKAFEESMTAEIFPALNEKLAASNSVLELESKRISREEIGYTDGTHF